MITSGRPIPDGAWFHNATCIKCYKTRQLMSVPLGEVYEDDGSVAAWNGGRYVCSDCVKLLPTNPGLHKENEQETMTEDG